MIEEIHFMFAIYDLFSVELFAENIVTCIPFEEIVKLDKKLRKLVVAHASPI